MRSLWTRGMLSGYRKIQEVYLMACGAGAAADRSQKTGEERWAHNACVFSWLASARWGPATRGPTKRSRSSSSSGLCTRHAAARADLEAEFPGAPRFETLDEALAATRPDAVADLRLHRASRRDGAQGARRGRARVLREAARRHAARRPNAIVAAAREARKTLLIGYILRVHPSWSRFVEIGRTLGKPLVMRMNLNQQSAASFWQVHKNIMRSTSPLVDCGVHDVDIMCQVTRARPSRCTRSGPAHR